MILMPNLKVVMVKELGKNLYIILVMGMASILIMLSKFPKGCFCRGVGVGVGRVIYDKVESNIGNEFDEGVKV